MSIEHTGYNELEMDKIKQFENLKSWVEDSLDLFKNDLQALLYPLFLKIYIDEISQGNVERAKAFFEKYKNEFENKSDLKEFESIYSRQHIIQNSIVYSFVCERYFLLMSKYAYGLLIHYLEDENMIYILKIMNSDMEIRIQTSSDGNTDVVSGVNIVCDAKPLNLHTPLASVETQGSVLSQDMYRYDQLEAFVHHIKRTRKADNLVKPSPSLVDAEIKKLSEFIKRVSVSSVYLPSICCYTLQNSYGNLTASVISNDFKFLACGYNNSCIEIHSLTKTQLRRLKKSSELLFADSSLNEDQFDEIGEVKRLIGHSGPIFDLRFSNTSKLLVSASADCTVRLWSLDLFECLAVYKTHSFPVWTLDFAPNDFFFASGGMDKQVILFCTKATVPERIYLSTSSDVTCIKFHPNFHYILVGSSDFKIRMHEIESTTLVRVFDGHNGTVTCMDVSHDGKLLVSGSTDRKLILWDLEKAKIINVYTGHESTIYSVSFCYNGSIFASSGADNSVRLWDISENQNTPIQTYYSKSTPIIHVKFSYRNIIACIGPYTGQSNK